MSDLLLDTPWWLPTVIVGVGLLVFLSGNKRVGDAPAKAGAVRNAGLGIMVLGVLLIALSYFVDTSKETVTKRSRQLVQSVEQRDWESLKSLVAEDVRVTAAEDARVGVIVLNFSGRDEVVAAARTGVERLGLNSAAVTAVDPREVGSTISVQVRIYSDSTKIGGQRVPSDWQFDWQKRGSQGWVVTDIKLLQIGTLSDEAVRSQLPKAK